MATEDAKIPEAPAAAKTAQSLPARVPSLGALVLLQGLIVLVGSAALQTSMMAFVPSDAQKSFFPHVMPIAQSLQVVSIATVAAGLRFLFWSGQARSTGWAVWRGFLSFLGAAVTAVLIFGMLSLLHPPSQGEGGSGGSCGPSQGMPNSPGPSQGMPNYPGGGYGPG